LLNTNLEEQLENTITDNIETLTEKINLHIFTNKTYYEVIMEQITENE